MIWNSTLCVLLLSVEVVSCQLRLSVEVYTERQTTIHPVPLTCILVDDVQTWPDRRSWHKTTCKLTPALDMCNCKKTSHAHDQSLASQKCKQILASMNETWATAFTNKQWHYANTSCAQHLPQTLAVLHTVQETSHIKHMTWVETKKQNTIAAFDPMPSDSWQLL